jgi:hypothetical protein
MQIRRFPQPLALALAVLFAILVGSVGADDSTFEGTWLSAVKIVTCPPAPYEEIATFEGMTTYIRGGIVIEGGAPPFPAVSRSAGHGIWERTGDHTFRAFFRFHSFDDLGRRVSIVEVTGHPRLIKGDNPETPDVLEPYYLSAKGNTNRITNLDPVDGTVIEVIEGCSEATQRPILFED